MTDRDLWRRAIDGEDPLPMTDNRWQYDADAGIWREILPTHPSTSERRKMSILSPLYTRQACANRLDAALAECVKAARAAIGCYESREMRDFGLAVLDAVSPLSDESERITNVFAAEMNDKERELHGVLEGNMRPTLRVIE
jgi:hypothetical protein